MASSSNFPKGEDVAEVPCRQDPSEVSTLSGRVSPLTQPYPPDYRAAFASSDIVYPPSRLPPLRSTETRPPPAPPRLEAGRVWPLSPGASDGGLLVRPPG